MYVCMYVCVPQVEYVCLYVRACVCKSQQYVCFGLSMYVCMYVCTHVAPVCVLQVLHECLCKYAYMQASSLYMFECMYETTDVRATTLLGLASLLARRVVQLART